MMKDFSLLLKKITSTLKNSRNDTYLLILSVLNLLFMHYYILLTCRVEEALDAICWIDNLLGVSVDIAIILIVALLFTMGRRHASLFITGFITLSWSFSNVLYSRFFHHYISLSAIGQVGNLTDSFMISNVLEGLSWIDFYYIISALLIIMAFFHSRKKTMTYPLKIFLALPLLLLFIDIFAHTAICIITPGLSSISYYQHRMYIRHIELLHSSAEPNWAHFHRGTIRQLFIPSIYQLFTKYELTEKEKITIEKVFLSHQERVTNTNNTIYGNNIIFIIVESYLSVTSDLTIEGKEVTPFLNSLKKDSTVFYNGELTPNISIGESSDGQFIYMTGLLPLRSEVTVTKAKYSELPGLPKLLKEEKIIHEAQMIIPTLPSMWEQEKMCEKYGFDKLLSSADYKNGKYWYLSDQQVFEYSLEEEMKAKQPFLSVILTMTMHQPYTHPADSTFRIRDKNLTEKYQNYLSTCHYTDKQIEWFFNQLKEKGLYDKSTIIIVADHHAHPSLFDMSEEDISTTIPLYIINGNINNSTGWQKHCNQLDVYTTLLDLIGTKNRWRGMGHTLITNNYKESVTPNIWRVSEQIILGNYFQDEKH